MGFHGIAGVADLAQGLPFADSFTWTGDDASVHHVGNQDDRPVAAKKDVIARGYLCVHLRGTIIGPSVP